MKLLLAFLFALSPRQQVDAFTTTTTTTTTFSRATVAPQFPLLALCSDGITPYDDDAEDDGLQTPTVEEQAAIDEAISHVLLPEGSFDAEEQFGKGRRVGGRLFGNSLLFRVLGIIQSATPLDDSVDLNEDIEFSQDVDRCMFFDIKRIDRRKRLGIMAAYNLLKFAPPLRTSVDTEPMTKEHIDEIYSGKVFPIHMMEVDSPEKCFLENAPVFCAPGKEGESVCDLDYLGKYAVKKGTPYRYGGKAVVKGGKITSISGSTEKDEDFDLKRNRFLSSFGVHVVLVHHAIMGHLAMYQKYLMKLTAERNDSYQNLWKENQSAGMLMKALTPYASNEVSYKIEVLVGPDNSLVGRATSLTNKSIMELNIDMHKKVSDMEPDEVVAYIGSNGSKDWETACQTSWAAAQRVVNLICRKIENSEYLRRTDLRDLAMLLWTGTFYHGFVGDFQLDNINKGNLVFPVTGEEHEHTVAYGTLAATIGCSTSQRTMEMSTLAKFFGEEDERDAWKEYHQILAECAKMTGVKGFSYDDTVYNAIDF
mmetsp:Transcript_27421/g.49829  ORF Transcript_27421/g.49829 Transcript_27421/m.49829 type:complete len:536 (-) Transcript_27421:144-1751(-)